tara:strand:+ start:531 stop:1133 length:603 start_codon:yes stop_codon:yes gene_type:complete
MAEEEYTKYLAQGKRPIAGQSLASDPENPAPYEKATEFSDVHEAIEYMFLSMIDEKSYMPIMQAVSSGTPVMELVQIILFDGFQKGKWNPDLMMMLAEPLAYIIIALAERADIEVSIYSGEKEDEDEEEQMFGVDFDSKRVEGLKKAAGLGQIPRGALPEGIVEQIEELPKIPAESLLAPPTAPEETPTTPSLMAPPTPQ